MRTGNAHRPLWVALALGGALWVLFAVVHSHVFAVGSFREQLLSPAHPGLTIRLLVVAVVVILAFYAQIQWRRRSCAEMRLAEREAHFRRLAEASVEGVLLHDGDRILEVNRAFADLVGYPLDDLVGLPYRHVFDPDAWARVAEKIRTGAPDPYDATLVASDGSRVPVEITARNTEMEGRPARVVTIRDVGHRKAVEKALRESEEKYRRLIEDLGEVVYRVTMPDGVFEYVSPAAEKTTGFPAQAFLESPGFFRRILDPSAVEEFDRRWADAAAGTVEPSHEYPILDPSGTRRWIRLTNHAVRDADGRVVALEGLCRDITREKEAEQKRRKTEAERRRSQKMEAAGALAGGVAHEFNNLLTSISGYSELLLDYLGDEDPIRHDVEEIREAGRRALDLTRKMLSFSRTHLVRPSAVDVNALLRDLTMEVEANAGSEIDVDLRLSPVLRSVRAETEGIRQALDQILRNAVDAMPDGGRLVIETADRTVSPEDCEGVPGARAGAVVHVRVIDTGIGMDEDTAARVFDPFFTTKKPGKGKGFGLSLAYAIIRQHGGWITLKSRPGEGTTFTVCLPAAMEALAPPAEEDEPLLNLQGDGERVLVVEDEEGLRTLCTRVLRENGYVVRDAGSAAEALEVFAREEEPFDLLFSDVVLPDHTADELARQLLEMRPGLRILLTSGHMDQIERYGALQDPGRSFLPKPYRLSRLLRMVREALQAAPAGHRALREAGPVENKSHGTGGRPAP